MAFLELSPLYLRTSCLVILCFIAFVTSHDDPGSSAMPTMGPAYFDNITISPSITVNYTLEVTTSSPAVLDSVVSFTARLLISPNGTEPEGRFQFLWLNTADENEDRSEGGHHTVLRKQFDGEMVQPGNFLMTVIVSPAGKEREIICFSSTEFKLTRHLNGNLRVKQNLEYQRNNVTFAIDQPIHFHVNITDRFDRPESPQYTYYWYNGSQLIRETDLPRYEQKFSQPTILHLQAVASAEFYVNHEPKLLPFDITDKIGSFQEKLVFKESLANCSMVRVDSSTEDQSLKLGRSLVLNITCTGSFPSAVCWNVTKLNATLNETCQPSDFHNRTQHQVSVSVSETGWNTVQLAVYNDISFNLLSQNFYVYDANTVNIPALVFPVVFIVLGLVIAGMGGTYIVRLRRKHHVEVADFDFDPTISVRSSRPLSSVLPAVKGFFSSRFHRPSQQTLGESQRILRIQHSMYESL